jgi:hypothetical protein
LAGFAKAMEVAKTPYLLVLPWIVPVYAKVSQNNH